MSNAIPSDFPAARRRRYRLRIMAAQCLHASLILGLPTAAVVLACWQVARGDAEVWMPVLAVLSYICTMTGITVGFHRLLAHRAFEAQPAVAALLAVLGSMAAQGAPIYWVSNHRRHHRYSDAGGDPHSPHADGTRTISGLRGFWHAHVGWMFTHELTSSIDFSRDLLQNRLISWVNRHYFLWIALGVALSAVIGYLLQPAIEGALNGLLWGTGVRLFLSYHLTSSINSITHLYGYRSFETRERSRNNWLLGIPTLGEAWHNNHHAFPTSAFFGMRWWEVDVGGWVIRLLQACGLAHAVRLHPRAALDSRPPSQPSSALREQGTEARTSPTINNPRLKRRQHINAAIATGMGFCGVAAAIGLAAYGRTPALAHIAIFLAFFLPVHLGVTVGFHRLFSHRSFEAAPGLRATLAILGSMAAQGPVTFWVALHRLHHEYADVPGDPHSPNLGGASHLQRLRGLVHAYIGWTVQHEVPNANHYARDILRDPLVMAINRHYSQVVLLGLLAPALLGMVVLGGMLGAVEGLVWGGLVRMCAGHHMIWWITSFAHVLGTQDYHTEDASRNNFWIALPTLGEGWHNNHHAFPNAAALDFHWWQLDISGAVIKTFGLLGWARNIRIPSIQARNARRLRGRASAAESTSQSPSISEKQS